jgi:hypothetical protein
MTKLQKQYENICNQYLKLFCKKQDFLFEHWIGDTVGGIAVCSDYFFDFSDIVYDVNTKQKKGMIVNWSEDNLNNPEKWINYYSYTKGLRIKTNEAI